MRRLTSLLLCLAVSLALSCGKRAPGTAPTPPADPQLVVVLVPGVAGTALVEADSGRTLWGDSRSLMSPRDRGYGLALPFDGERAQPSVIAGGALDRLWLGPIHANIYGPWKRRMAEAGYPVGDPAAPDDDARFFVFGYDWRKSSVDSARALGEWLESLARRRGRPQRVALIAHSNGAFVARYLSRYGAVSLDEALAGRRRPPVDVTIAGLALVGTANGGAIGVLREMNEGRRNVPVVGRRWLPEILFTFPSLYEALPAYRRHAFVDDAGRVLDVDVFDAAAWPEHGWSIFGDRVERRLERSGSTLFGDRDARLRFLDSRLREALRVHRALLRDPSGWRSPPLISLQHGDRDTVERAALVRRKDGWHTRFDRAAARVAGDGHASRESQDALSAAEAAALVEPTVYADGTHFGVVLEASVQRRVLEFLNELSQP